MACNGTASYGCRPFPFPPPAGPQPSFFQGSVLTLLWLGGAVVLSLFGCLACQLRQIRRGLPPPLPPRLPAPPGPGGAHLPPPPPPLAKQPSWTVRYGFRVEQPDGEFGVATTRSPAHPHQTLGDAIAALGRTASGAIAVVVGLGGRQSSLALAAAAPQQPGQPSPARGADGGAGAAAPGGARPPQSAGRLQARGGGGGDGGGGGGGGGGPGPGRVRIVADMESGGW